MLEATEAELRSGMGTYTVLSRASSNGEAGLCGKYRDCAQASDILVEKWSATIWS